MKCFNTFCERWLYFPLCVNNANKIGYYHFNDGPFEKDCHDPDLDASHICESPKSHLTRNKNFYEMDNY